MMISHRLHSSASGNHRILVGEVKRTLRWGILGCGLISGDFAQSLSSCKYRNEILAISASNSIKHAQEFRDRHILNGQKREQVRCYGSYSELLAATDIDIVYIGVVNHLHMSVAIDAMCAGKHVLCEKPLGVNKNEVKTMIECARKNNVLLMEGYWSRFFPIWREIQQEVPKTIGGAQMVLCDFGIGVDRVGRTDPMLGGGGFLLANGCYTVMFAQFIFGDEKPEKVSAHGQLSQDGTIDQWASITLKYSNNRLAQLFYSGVHGTTCQASISGPDGHLKLPRQFWSPSIMTTELRGQQIDPQVISHPLPVNETGAEYFYQNTIGLCYEVDHIYECLQQGLVESPIMPLTASLLIAEILDDVRAQLGVHYPQDQGLV